MQLQENNMTELNNLFAKIDDRRRVSKFCFDMNVNKIKTNIRRSVD